MTLAQTSAHWIGDKPSILNVDVNETLIGFESMKPLSADLPALANEIITMWCGRPCVAAPAHAGEVPFTSPETKSSMP
jgi:hypothetical protein